MPAGVINPNGCAKEQPDLRCLRDGALAEAMSSAVLFCLTGLPITTPEGDVVAVCAFGSAFSANVAPSSGGSCTSGGSGTTAIPAGVRRRANSLSLCGLRVANTSSAPALAGSGGVGER